MLHKTPEFYSFFTEFALYSLACVFAVNRWHGRGLIFIGVCTLILMATVGPLHFQPAAK
jgi:hypothetical protein